MKNESDRTYAQLSDQAVFILRQFVVSGGAQLFYADWGGGQFSLQVLDKPAEMLVTDPRFIQDDLNQLVNLQLLTVEYNSQGNPIFGITRRAAHFIAGDANLSNQKKTPEAVEIADAGKGLYPGQTFGKWILEESIGGGGNGVVWSAKNPENRIVAIKFLHPDYFGKQREQRFRDEIEFLRRESKRPGILPLIDFYLPEKFSGADRPWFTTPFSQCFSKL